MKYAKLRIEDVARHQVAANRDGVSYLAVMAREGGGFDVFMYQAAERWLVVAHKCYDRRLNAVRDIEHGSFAMWNEFIELHRADELEAQSARPMLGGVLVGALRNKGRANVH